jgi:hypothetical protein
VTEAERIAALEERMKASEKRDEEIIAKLDDLLALKNKGMGAFWIVSIIMGAAFTAVMSLVTGWLNGN